MENIVKQIEFLQQELRKKENQSKSKQRHLIQQLKEAKQEKLDFTKKQIEDFEKMNRNLEKALEMAKTKTSLDEIKQKLGIDHIIVRK
jgi:nicotinamidase-related amidase